MMVSSIENILDAKTLSLVFENIDTAVFIGNLSRQIVAMNTAAEDLFGYKKEELIGQSTQVLYAKSSDFNKQGTYRFNAESNLVDDSYSMDYRNKADKTFKGQTTAGAIKDNLGNTLFFVVMIKDESSRLAAEGALNKLHTITSSRSLDFTQRVDEILKLGTEHFGLPIGIFSKVVDDEYVVQQAIHPDGALDSGMTFDLGITYCWHVYQSNDVQGFHHVSQSTIVSHPCYQSFKLEAYLGTPIFVDGARYGTLNFSSPEPTRPFIRQDFDLIRLFAEWIGHEIARNNDLLELKNAHQQMRILADTDALTGLPNRGCTERVMNQYLNRVKGSASRRKLACALFDFDYFKSINDNYGHHIGDEVLKLFAQSVQIGCRDDDHYGRWGGEEFLAIFPDKSAEDVLPILQRLKKEMYGRPIRSKGEVIVPTFSIGLTDCQGDSINEVLKRVDGLLYKAKDNGRDRIEVG